MRPRELRLLAGATGFVTQMTFLVPLQAPGGAEELAAAMTGAAERALRVDAHFAGRIGGRSVRQLMVCGRWLGQIRLAAAEGAEEAPLLARRGG